jgi:hypothetical protein
VGASTVGEEPAASPSPRVGVRLEGEPTVLTAPSSERAGQGDDVALPGLTPPIIGEDPALPLAMDAGDACRYAEGLKMLPPPAGAPPASGDAAAAAAGLEAAAAAAVVGALAAGAAGGTTAAGAPAFAANTLGAPAELPLSLRLLPLLVSLADALPPAPSPSIAAAPPDGDDADEDDEEVAEAADEAGAPADCDGEA